MLNSILEAIIPAEPERGLPSAAAIGFTAYCSQYVLQDLSDKFCVDVEAMTRKELGVDFRALDEDTRLRMLNLCRSRDIRLFSSFITHVFRAYYSHPDVLGRIGSGVVPPFPHGNAMPLDDWSILEPVFNRGSVYRRVE